jgi:FkbM family methyltransferase
MNNYAMLYKKMNAIKPIMQQGSLLVTKHFIHQRIDDILFIHEQLADDSSKDLFLRVIKARLTNNPLYLSITTYPRYRHPLVHADLSDVVCDIGLCTERTPELFSLEVGSQGKVYGFEAVPEYAANIKSALKGSSNIVIENCGIWSCIVTQFIHPRQGGSKLSISCDNNAEACECHTLDTYLAEKNSHCDLIKMDIEGAERYALQGCKDTIRRWKPKLMIAVYHDNTDWLEIPLSLMRDNPEYIFYLGHHNYSSLFGTILYAASPENIRLQVETNNHKQREMDNEVQCAAINLYGIEVLFYGAGAAFDRYKSCFTGVKPMAMLLDSQYIQCNTNITEEGIPVRDPQSLLDNEKIFPVIIFCRQQNIRSMYDRVKTVFPDLQQEKVVWCILYM